MTGHIIDSTRQSRMNSRLPPRTLPGLNQLCQLNETRTKWCINRATLKTHGRFSSASLNRSNSATVPQRSPALNVIHSTGQARHISPEYSQLIFQVFGLKVPNREYVRWALHKVNVIYSLSNEHTCKDATSAYSQPGRR